MFIKELLDGFSNGQECPLDLGLGCAECLFATATSTAAQMSHQGLSQSVAKDDAAWQFRSMKLTAVFEPAKEDGYTCFVEEIPSAISQGETLAEAKANLLDALKAGAGVPGGLPTRASHALSKGQDPHAALVPPALAQIVAQTLTGPSFHRPASSSVLAESGIERMSAPVSATSVIKL